MAQKSVGAKKVEKTADMDHDRRDRPGVPMEKAPADLPAVPLERQEARVTVFKRVGLEELTPVFGTAQPPRGLSGLLRRQAYRVPGHRAAHWEMLLLADRIDSLEGRVADLFTRRPYAGLWVLGIGIGILALASSLKAPSTAKGETYGGRAAA